MKWNTKVEYNSSAHGDCVHMVLLGAQQYQLEPLLKNNLEGSIPNTLGANSVNGINGNNTISSLQHVQALPKDHFINYYAPLSDLTINACAYSPGKKESQWISSVQWGQYFREIQIIGPRLLYKTFSGCIKMTKAQELEQIPITPQYAYGGLYQDSKDQKHYHPANPHGMGFHCKSLSMRTELQLPCIENPHHLLLKKHFALPTPMHYNQAPAPVLINTLPANHPDRLGACEVGAMHATACQKAPILQRAKELKSHQGIHLVHLSPCPHVFFKLPAMGVWAMLQTNHKECKKRARMQNIHIDAIHNMVYISWSAIFPVSIEQMDSCEDLQFEMSSTTHETSTH